MVYSVDDRFITEEVKDADQHWDEEIHKGKHGKGSRTSKPSLSVPFFSQIVTCSPTCGPSLLGAPLPAHGQCSQSPGTGTRLSLLCFCWRSGLELKAPTLNTGLAASPHLWVWSKRCLINMAKHLYYSHLLGNTFRNMPEARVSQICNSYYILHFTVWVQFPNL